VQEELCDPDQPRKELQIVLGALWRYRGGAELYFPKKLCPDYTMVSREQQSRRATSSIARRSRFILGPSRLMERAILGSQ
jgi:hypothetical protein